MLIDDILQRAGFEKNKTYCETLFRHPPRVNYAVYNDSWERRGSDDKNLIKEHDVTIEFYQYKPDSEKEEKIEQTFDDMSIPFTKQERYWIQDEQLFQTIYEFSYIEKEDMKNV
mgnify:FL=1